MALQIEIDLTYGPSGTLGDPAPRDIANEVARLARRPVEHFTTTAGVVGFAEPSITVDDTTVRIVFVVEEAPKKGTLERLQWIVDAVVARLLRHTHADRPDLATNPVTIAVRLDSK